MHICLHSQRIGRIFRSLSRPSFSIYINRRIYFIHRFTNLVHCLYIVNSHQVKTKTIDMIFINPVQYRFNHILTHHGTVTCSLIPATGTIGQCSIFLMTIKIAGHSTLKVTVSRVECMIVDHIKYYTNTCFVQSLHHLFEFLNTYSWIVWISRV